MTPGVMQDQEGCTVTTSTFQARLKTQEYWLIFLKTSLNPLVLWPLRPFFQDMFSSPALSVLSRQISGKSSSCLWFLAPVKEGARVFVWEGERPYLCQRSRHQVASEQRSQAGGRRQGKMPSLG